jgi:hypothetical protein
MYSPQREMRNTAREPPREMILIHFTPGRIKTINASKKGNMISSPVIILKK